MTINEAVDTWLSYEDSDRYDEEKSRKVLEARITIREALRRGYKLCKIDEDCIRREEAINLVHNLAQPCDDSYDWDISADDMIDGIKDLPSVQQQPKTGHWIDIGATHSQCDKCLAVFEIVSANGEANYCPNCGADMRGESE